MTDRYYTFSVPVRGEEIVVVAASSLEEAKAKYIEGDYIEQAYDDMDVDIGYGCDLDAYLDGAVRVGCEVKNGN